MKLALVISYFFVLGTLAMYGLHRCALLWLYYRHKAKMPVSPGTPTRLPRVTAQLPIYNERHVVERLLRAVAEMEYPRELIEIQVLDDSDDETQEVARGCVEKLRQAGLNITYVHRVGRAGFKAGALAEGLKAASGELIAVFDADFVPPRDFLRKVVPFFADPSVGMVQARWGHLNRDDSLLTKAQAILLDGHFQVEHAARSWSGRFFNFNGSAGVWRKEAILAAGGWQGDTLTEDMDISYRAQLAGWKFVYLPEVSVPAELPVEMSAFLSQQHRWAKGTAQTAKKLLPRIWRAALPLKVKMEATWHLGTGFVYVFMVLLALVIFPAFWVRGVTVWSVALIDLPLFVLALGSASVFYVAAQREIYGDRRALKFLPFLTLLGIGISVSNARGVIEGLFEGTGTFERTPKCGYRSKAHGFRALGLCFAVYMVLMIVIAIGSRCYVAIPFLLIFLAGYGYVVVAQSFESFRGLTMRRSSCGA